MLHRCFDELVREQPFTGRVLGIKAHYSPRQHPETGELLQSYWQNGNVDERRETVNIRVRQAVILASGGHAGNPEVRSMFYPALREPAFPTSGLALQGPHGQDASALIAGLRVGANLAGMQQNVSYSTTFHIATRLGTRDAYTSMMPGHPTFGFRASAGINVGNTGFEEFIAVNQVGKRFFSEVRLPARPGLNRYPGDRGAPGQGLAHTPLDWRNCRKEWVREMYNYDHGLDAALALNEGSQPPDYYSGPLWAVFDQDAVERTGWELRYPYVSDNGYFFQADTVEDLAEKIAAGHEFQRVPLSYLADDRGHLERLCRRRRRSRIRARGRCPHESHRDPALLCALDHGDLARFLWRPAGQRPAAGRGHAGPGDFRSLCGRRGRGRVQQAWSGQGSRPWLHRRHACRR